MKKYVVYLILLSLFLTACTSKEERIGMAAQEDLSELYDLDDVEVLSVEYTKPPGAFIVFSLDYLFNGKTYDVVLQVNESPPVKVEGQINERKLEFESDDYVSAKHDIVSEENKAYKEIVEQLSGSGIKISDVYDSYFTDIKRTIHFNLIGDKIMMSSEEIVAQLRLMSDMLIAPVGSAISSRLSVQANEFSRGEVEKELFEIEIAPYDDDEALIEVFHDQIVAINSVNRLDESFIQNFEKHFLALNRSSLDYIWPFENNDQKSKFVRHEVLMNVLPDYELEDLLAGFKLLQDEGFNKTFIQLFFASGITDYCQVQEIETIADIERCYTTIIQPAIEWED